MHPTHDQTPTNVVLTRVPLLMPLVRIQAFQRMED